MDDDQIPPSPYYVYVRVGFHLKKLAILEKATDEPLQHITATFEDRGKLAKHIERLCEFWDGEFRRCKEKHT